MKCSYLLVVISYLASYDCYLPSKNILVSPPAPCAGSLSHGRRVVALGAGLAHGVELARVADVHRANLTAECSKV